MAVIFLAVVALLGIWGTYFVADSLGITFKLPGAIFLTGMVWLSAASWFVIRKLRAKAQSAQANEQERTAWSDLQPQIQEMRTEFQRAVHSLKNSRLGRSGTNALPDLPWYMVIGPPRTGKSTALRNPELKFRHLGRKIGLGGARARSCDWWLTTEGVILDTPVATSPKWMIKRSGYPFWTR